MEMMTKMRKKVKQNPQHKLHQNEIKFSLVQHPAVEFAKVRDTSTSIFKATAGKNLERKCVRMRMKLN
jgi:hypothetical protein